MRAVEDDVLADRQAMALRVALRQQRLRLTGDHKAARRDLGRGHDPDRLLSGVNSTDREGRAADVGLRRIHHLLDRLGGDRHGELAAAKSLGQALVEGRVVEVAGLLRRLHARLDLALLGCGQRCSGLVDGDRLGGQLQLGDDLGHGSFLVHDLQGQAGGHVGDARHEPHLVRHPGRKGRLARGQEEVVHEVIARIAELREVGDHGLHLVADLGR